MNAARKIDAGEAVITRRGLRLLRGSNTLSARKGVSRRDGRIRLVRDADRQPAAARSQDEPAVIAAHARLRLPSLERWLTGRIW